MKNYSQYPDFDDLPPVEGMPQGCAWGIFDVNGKKDYFGTLNWLTPDIVKAAASEVKDGHSISLNWPLNGMKLPLPGRKAPVHTPFPLAESVHATSWDDTLDFNTQSSSQWDSLCHFQHQPSGLSYNGAKCTQDNLSVTSTADNTMPTLDHWHDRGGVVARGVLIDYKQYFEDKVSDGKTTWSPLDGYRITAKDIEDVAQHQGVEFKPGDILIVRTGFTDTMSNPVPEEMMKMQNGTMSGVTGTVETAKWAWNKRFSAVAGDAIAFEAYPPLLEDGSVGETKDLVLHPWFLAMFGMPIGELWDLKELSAYCKNTKRYSFMLTSAPLNHPGLVGSPPNALAIF